MDISQRLLMAGMHITEYNSYFLTSTPASVYTFSVHTTSRPTNYSTTFNITYTYFYNTTTPAYVTYFETFINNGTDMRQTSRNVPSETHQTYKITTRATTSSGVRTTTFNITNYYYSNYSSSFFTSSPVKKFTTW